MSTVYTHLAFTGAQYALCGATVSEKNPKTVIIGNASCPGCLEEHRVTEQVHAALHSGRGPAMKAEYER